MLVFIIYIYFYIDREIERNIIWIYRDMIEIGMEIDRDRDKDRGRDRERVKVEVLGIFKDM